jgi:hypothetical protein
MHFECERKKERAERGVYGVSGINGVGKILIKGAI